jgi:hypothetical protein
VKSYKDFNLIFINGYENAENALHRKVKREKQMYKGGK